MRTAATRPRSTCSRAASRRAGAQGSRASVVSEAGDFLFIPPGVPHEAINLSATEPARAIVARNDPAEQDNVVPYVG